MRTKPPEIEIRQVQDFGQLGALWRDLEMRSAASFFQSWTWTGCLADERFPAPWLMTARSDDAIIALALFNRAGRGGFPGLPPPLLLAESGTPERDAIFIEHNGLLLDRSADDTLAQSCWRTLSADAEHGLAGTRWLLSGVAPGTRAALPADRSVRVTARRPAPYRDLAAAAPDMRIIDLLSANTRQQLRRSLRAWEAIGPLKLDIAATEDEADMFLDALAELHQRYWTSRGKPGAFANPFFRRFHYALIRRTGHRQSADLIRVSAGGRIVGYLYNFVHQGWVTAYQSGFDFGPDADRLRPGLVCHLLAMEHYRHAGMRLYDFLGGEARYKRSLANAETELLWLDVRPKFAWPTRWRAIFSSWI